MKNKEKIEILVAALQGIYNACESPWSNPYMEINIKKDVIKALSEIGEDNEQKN